MIRIKKFKKFHLRNRFLSCKGKFFFKRKILVVLTISFNFIASRQANYVHIHDSD